MRPETSESLILQALRKGPLPTAELADLAGVSRRVVQRMVGPMCDAKKIEIYGNAMEFGFQRHQGPSGFVFGLPRSRPVVAADPDEAPVVKRGGRRSGSGIIAPRPYATGFRWGNV